MYLVNKKRPSGMMHIWTGSDTKCRMWSTGGIVNKKKWDKTPEQSGRICAMCEAAKNDPEPIVKTPKKQAKTAYFADPKSNAFLQSYAWKKLRLKVIKKYGAVCMCCGDSPATGAVINVDHIKPRKLFPELALEESNLQILCHDCNQGKGNWDQTDWRPAEQENSYDPLLECLGRMKNG